MDVESISANKLATQQAQAQVKVAKKANDSEGEVAKKLIESATSTPNPPGLGAKLDVKV